MRHHDVHTVPLDALRISGVAELLSHEAEIVRRIALLPNGARLMALDPQRVFRQVGVELTPTALCECSATVL